MKMEGKGENPSTRFTSAMSLTSSGIPRVPERYVLPPSERPEHSTNISTTTTTLPVIDLASLHHPSGRSKVINEIARACKERGFFQEANMVLNVHKDVDVKSVINHGIPLSVMKNALDIATDFFNLPVEEKMVLSSDNVHRPVRYGTSVNHVKDKVHFWRDFVKHYCHPISSWVHLWPANPPTYKQKMGEYAIAVNSLQKQLVEAVIESLGLKSNYLREGIEQGSQVMAVNCYPTCPEPQLALGMPPHSDYGSLTILLQSSLGLQAMDRNNNNWISVPVIEGALIVQLGDQIEVMSNGLYKSVIHRVTVSSDNKRLSLASLHSLPIDKKMGPALELVNEQHPAGYKEFSFQDFLEFISGNDIREGRFIETLRINP